MGIYLCIYMHIDVFMYILVYGTTAAIATIVLRAIKGGRKHFVRVPFFSCPFAIRTHYIVGGARAP